MGDIGRRISRYRLSRYATPQGGLGRPPRWVWVVAALWLAWVGLVSDHSLYRIWRTSADAARTRRDLEEAQREITRHDREARDPGQRAREAEAVLRGQGYARQNEIIYRIGGASPDTLAR